MILHPFQTEALAALARPKTHLALTAPTGSGKGVILEILAKDPAERILVLTPLVALARQQRLRFLARGVPADRVRIASPESALLRAREIREWRPTLIAVDEAHCLREWGERFRPAYGKLLQFTASLGCPRTLWMSATFPRDLAEELERGLAGTWTRIGRFRMPTRLSTDFRRVSPADRIELVHRSARVNPAPGVVFGGTRKEVERYARLIATDRPTFAYHAGLSDEERRNIEGLLTRESSAPEARTSIVATNAFGMGMDFHQFRWALLAHAPFSLLGLMQAFGRVGRGENGGEAALYWAEEDFRFAGLLLGEAASTAQRRLVVLRDYLEGTAEDRSRVAESEFL